jgi:hypothetical protein
VATLSQSFVQVDEHILYSILSIVSVAQPIAGILQKLETFSLHQLL